MRTFPVAAVELDAHADGLGMRAVREEPDASGDDRGVDLPQLRDVRVHVPLKDLWTEKAGNQEV